MAHETQTIELPAYGIVVEVHRHDNGLVSGNVQADQLYEEVDTPELQAALDGVMSMVLAQACEGVVINSPLYLCALETAIDAVFNHYDFDRETEDV